MVILRATQYEIKLAGYQWLTPVILAIQEAEIRRLLLEARTRKIV
jgi:hypothetical protein